MRFDLGPSLIRRENVQRVAVLTANIAGADLAGTVEEAARRLDGTLVLPTGYRVAYAGQFEEAASGVRILALISAFILVAMYGLLFFAFRRHRYATIVLVNLDDLWETDVRKNLLVVRCRLGIGASVNLAHPAKPKVSSAEELRLGATVTVVMMVQGAESIPNHHF